VISNLLSYNQDEIGFCEKISGFDAREIVSGFCGRINRFIAFDYTMTGDPDNSYEEGDRF